jgi:hypothetical protein
MEGRRVRLGDVIDDYCQKCRLIMNHGVVGMVEDEVRKVRSNTCKSEHLYKHGRLPKRRRNETGKLFDEVLRGLGREPSAPEPDRPEGNDEEPEEIAAAPAPTADPDEAPEEPAAPAAAAPAEPAPAPLSEDEAAHGVRRKLYTIRRHSGGKPPGTGTPGTGTPGR